MTDKAFVSVFRSSKKDDTYLFVRRGQEWAELPDALKEIFGNPVHSMDLVLTPDRKLARTTGKQVLEALDDRGFFLQMPEEQEGYVMEFRKKLERDRP
ncbi:YcgL domain-containing protein [Marinobacter salinisoli]|uniref:YcgL domain-containing protein LPB19_10880 n=1 Tax=Marinobacter salinisoli TaxID=2769486 RepID=A0ABX7MQC9_9GAMM|nr:YcgL domain-containing protein [Marinobacter salinisoli]QSP93707.1 YcgL domain-containing protein [Marinobacter salinisoli]